MATTAEIVMRFVDVRAARDAAKSRRDDCICEREQVGLVESEKNPTPVEPCWKAARKWTGPTPYSDGGKFYLDPPPSAWCEPCQRRQAASDEYRQLVRSHAGALRGLIRHGKTLSKARG